MKNQYFGDVNDLFKYDLVEWLALNMGGIERFTFVPMLTPNDGSGEGNKLDYARRPGSNNASLLEYLEDRVVKHKRDISQIERYFRVCGLEAYVHEGSCTFFAHAVRTSYFQSIEDCHLAKAIILVDPDNGLEIKRSREKHILLCEVESLYDRMSGGSVLMIFQHFRREPRALTLEKASAQLQSVCSTVPAWLCDQHIAFFFLARNKQTRRNLGKALQAYKEQYPDRRPLALGLP